MACADFTFPILPHHQVLQLISMLGFKGVDIGLFEDRSHLQPSSEFKSVSRSARSLKKKLDDNGLAAADLFLQLALDYESYAVNQPRPQRRRQARDAFLKTLDYAAGCKGKHITGLPGVHFKEERLSDSMARAVEELAWRVEKARAYRIVFGIEPHIGSFADTPKRAAKLVQDVPGLTLTLDYGHLFPRGFHEKEIEQLIQYSSHFHARGTNKHSGSSSLADNTLDWKRIFAVMEKTGYRGWIELEYGGNNVTETICFRDYFRSLFR
ncbi:MAG: sugar phosphate isomerase/epimerase [Candidatus Latescibacteria bacterium]|nr:sugar phosphate isomerase/epimerase [Candidatus Latescibacterota bacterium]